MWWLLGDKEEVGIEVVVVGEKEEEVESWELFLLFLLFSCPF